MDKEIIRAYKQLESVKMVARSLDVSVVKVRRTLITAGLWRSKRSDAYLDLLHKGLTPDEIANKYGVSKKAVEAYMPYTQGSYGGSDKSYLVSITVLTNMTPNTNSTPAASSSSMNTLRKICLRFLISEMQAAMRF